MERPTADLATYPDAYEKKELEGLMEPLAKAYEVKVRYMGNGSGHDLRLAIGAVVFANLIRPFVEEVVKEWAKEFAIWVKHFVKKSPENAGAVIPLEIVSSVPKGYYHPGSGVFEIRVEPIRINTREADDPERLISRLANDLAMIEKGLAEIWKPSKQGKCLQGSQM